MAGIFTFSLAVLLLNSQIAQASNQGATSLVSSGLGGALANNSSVPTAISDNGRFVLFESAANNLVPDDTNGEMDIFMRDRQQNTVTRISVSSANEQATGGFSSQSDMSADGRYIVFTSGASNLGQPYNNSAPDVYLHDMQTGTTTVVCLNSFNGQQCAFPHISADGNFITYSTTRPFVDPNSPNQVFRYERATGDRVLVSTTSSSVAANSNSLARDISVDGRYIVFDSVANNLVPGDTNGQNDVFVRDMNTGTITRANVNNDGVQGNHYGQFPTISGDGRYVAFESYASNFVENDPANTLDVFVRDMQANETKLVSRNITDGVGNYSSGSPSMSVDGRYVSFTSTASNLVPDDTNNKQDVFVYDMQTEEIVRVSVSSSGVQAVYGSGASVINASGKFIAFHSNSPDLIGNDPVISNTNVYLRERIFDTTPPTVSSVSLSTNPKAISQSSVLTATVTDDLSNVTQVEYFIDNDPGQGNGVAMSFSDGMASATLGTNLAQGIYPVSVRAQDEIGNWSNPQIVYLVVYDPANTQSAKGGGWIIPGGSNSDPGDALPGLNGSSRATFGFLVDYQSGQSTVPHGNLQFRYQAGNFLLESAGYDWLVVTNNNWAKFQGRGTIDNTGTLYPFRVEARDGNISGQPDRFIIKVWAATANPDIDEPLYKASGDVQGSVQIN